MTIPNWYEALLLSLAAWRIYQLLALDAILDQPRRYVTRLGKKWEQEGDSIPKEYREKWALFLNCPYCLGFWVALAWFGAYEIWPFATLVGSVPFALSAGVVAGHKLLSSE